jgi:putative flippase GtrA
MISQFLKFLIVGANNTGIDFLILNLLMSSFNLYKGWPIIFFNIISFTFAVTNSYLVNRFWTFSKKGDEKIKKGQIFLVFILLLILFNLKFFNNKTIFIFLVILFFSLVILIDSFIVKNFLFKENFKESSIKYGKFVFFTLIGMAINTAIVYSFTTFISPPFNLSLPIWANFSKAFATFVSLFWNFFSYKFMVFTS